MKTCLHCGKPYDRPSGFKRVRKDYGYCSMKCIQSSKPPCPNCGNPIVRRLKERPYAFIRRNYCSMKCGASHANSFPKSPEHRQKVIDARLRYLHSDEGRQQSAESGKRFSEWLKTEDGHKFRQNNVLASRAWRKTQEGIEWKSRVDEIRRTPEYSAKVSQSLSEFWETDKANELRRLYRELYSGIPRPPEVTEKMKNSLAKFHDSPEGIAFAIRMSLERTDGLPDCPYGPNWKRQRRKALKRDNFTCQICGCTDFSPRTEPDVHHIYRRRAFGYIPGENENFRWANHLHNLISLCASCHRRVEMKVIVVPEHFLSPATEHYQKFVTSA